MEIESNGRYEIEGKKVLLFTEHYEGLPSKCFAEIWDDVEQILSIPSHDKNVITCSVISYGKGFGSGQAYGESKVQSRIRHTLGL